MIENKVSLVILSEEKDITKVNTDFSVSLADIFFKGEAKKGNLRNLLEDPFFTYVKELGFRNFLYPTDGTLSKYIHAPLKGKGDGYNLRKEDFDKEKDSFDTFNGGISSVKWGVDFATEAYELKTALGVNCDFVANVKYGSKEEDRWFFSLFNPKRIKWGSECLLTWDAESYKKEVLLRSPCLPKVIRVIDAGLVHRLNHKPTQEWNKVVSSIPFEEADTYWQLGDRVQLGSNMEENLEKILYYFDTVLPADIEEFKRVFPGKRLFVGQLNVEDNREGKKKYIDNTMLGQFVIGKYYQVALTNTTLISYLCWMSLRNLIDSKNNLSENYHTLKALNYTQKGEFLCSSFIEGESKVSVTALLGKNTYYLILTNYSDKAAEISKVYLNGKTISKSMNYYICSRHANSWDGTIVTTTFTCSSISIAPRSICTVTFNSKKGDLKPPFFFVSQGRSNCS